MNILMCKPNHYDIAYEINPWMSINNKADKNLVAQQWKLLYDTIKKTGANIHLIDSAAGLPDMVFTANAGLVIGSSFFPSNFRNPERQLEAFHYTKWFKDHSYKIEQITSNKNIFFEGAGDALIAGHTLFAGFGFRSEENYYDIQDIPLKNIARCKLVNPRFYHLDTCFCPINDNFAIWYPDAFDAKSQKLIRKNISTYPVPEDEAKAFACNAVVLGNYIILPLEAPKTKLYLQKLGYEVFTCDMSEFLKSGGACKCLTLILPDKMHLEARNETTLEFLTA